ncbi:TraR/DksA C4-type zinc finger protein [Alkalihalobacillus pseudalcaliphilus]|uniref:TraR/DksA C4-type zinc finger protein n=1 Tax=Alkalihalobacillus pseudalcaliphilus TaxID=79884 RepID=UPI00064DC0C4|nr:TraR/DksA C4-type zinc finger protein [Alkalihalobacillus pseudalcaliphilus]KMK77135.1 hypothetical protein AB990_06185 [Alkalihalobacillus pseudalcaliphilus]
MKIDKSYQHIYTQLTEQKEQLEQKLKRYQESELHQSEADSSTELSQYDNHPADNATDLYEREKDFALEEHAEDEYEQVKAALQKFEEGTFGICEKTGKEIPLERLEANPLAKTVIEEANSHVEDYRPVEEDVLVSPERYNYDGDDTETEFDAEDAYQAVASYNERPNIYEDPATDQEEEEIGYVDELDGFLSTDLEGFKGAEHVHVQNNRRLRDYLEEEDEESRDE